MGKRRSRDLGLSPDELDTVRKLVYELFGPGPDLYSDYRDYSDYGDYGDYGGPDCDFCGRGCYFSSDYYYCRWTREWCCDECYWYGSAGDQTYHIRKAPSAPSNYNMRRRHPSGHN